MPVRVLITRPREDAEPLAIELSRRGVDSLVEPLLEIEPVVPDEPLPLDGAQGLLFTSANGVRAFAETSDRRDIAAWCVGPASAAAARRTGFRRVESADGDVLALASIIAAKLDPAAGHLLHVAGATLAGDLAGGLRAKGFDCRRVTLYRAVPAKRFSPAAEAALRSGSLDAVTLFSPRTAEAFARLVTDAGLTSVLGRVTAYAISEQAAARAAALPWARIRIAPQPDQSGILALLTEDGLNEAKGRDETVPERPASAAAAGPTAPAAGPEEVAPRKPGRGFPTLLSLGLLLAVVAAGGYAAWRFNPALFGMGDPSPAAPGRTAVPVPPVPSPPISPTAGPSTAGSPTADAIQSTAARLDSLEKRVAALPDLQELSTELKDLRQRLGKLESDLRAGLAAIDSRLAEPAPNGANPAEIAEIRNRLDRLSARVAESGEGATSAKLAEIERALLVDAQRLAAMEAETRQLGERLQSAGEIARRATLVVAVGQLRQAALGGRPFVSELGAARKLGADIVAPQAVEELTRRAADGIVSPRTLAAQLERLAPVILQAEHRQENPAWWQRVIDRLASLVSIRRTGEREGRDAEAVIARAEVRLASDNVAAAAAEIEQLGAAALAAAQPWLQAADARARIERALDELQRAALADIGPVSRP